MSTETAPPATQSPAADGSGRTALRFLRLRELGIVLALVLLVGVTAASNPRFLSPQSIRDLLLSAVILMTLAVGQTILIVTRNIDLSVGSIVGLVAAAVRAVWQHGPMGCGGVAGRWEGQEIVTAG
jgi:rhamnose transport system permease protein